MSNEKSVGIYLTSMTMGGAERVALNLCTGLANRGYNVDLVLVEATGELLDDVPSNVSVVDLDAGRVMKSLPPLQKYLSSKEPDVLYSMMTEPNLIAILANLFTSIETKLIISEHNMLSHSSESLKDQFVKAGAWALYPFADRVVAVSRGVRHDLISNTRLDIDSISVIYNPVDVKSIQKLAREPVKNTWLTDKSLKVVLAGGRHEPQKGFDVLLSAFNQLNRDDLRLILFGTGPETEALKSQAASLGIKKSVYFPGFVENPFNYMAAADLFVLSSKYEGFGLVLIEALACGCPVVSTDCKSGPAEILDNGTYGSLVPVGNIMLLAEAMEETLSNSCDSEMLRARADDFNIETAVSHYESLFHS